MDRTINCTSLQNGVKIVSRRMPYVRSVSMGVWVNVGARDETAPESGLSHFIEHMIFKGTARRSAYQIAKEFDAIGGQTNAFTSMEHTCYHAKVLDTHLETMVDILSDIFLNSTFDTKEVDRERPVIFQEIGMLEDSPEELIHFLTGKNYWGDHSLGRSILGTRENIAAFDAGDIKNFFLRFYQPERILISIAGNVDHDRFVDLVAPQFETIRPGNGFPKRTIPQGRARIELHNKSLEQLHICLNTPGLSSTAPGRFALSLLNTILGGNMSSRLFQKIREQKGLAYSVYSYIASHTDAGMYGAYAGVNPLDGPETVALMMKELAGIAAKPVKSQELSDAKEFTIGNIYLASESPDNQMVRLAQSEFSFGRYVPLKEVVAKIEAVSTDEVLHMAQELFRPRQVSMTVLGPISDPTSYEGLIGNAPVNLIRND
jgi:predicted Zn-dependent peptidase